MIKTKAVFSRKENNLHPQDVIVEKVITLSSRDYDFFSKNLLRDHDFIAENSALMYHGNDGMHCLLVNGEGRNDGILIQGEGSNYARYSAYVPDVRGLVESKMRFSDLMSVPLENLHLVHTDEEIEDLHTIVELKPGTLTDDGKMAWSDILDAKVERIFEGGYGLQVELSGVEAQRIGDFSQMLAGFCPAKDYDRWIKDDAPPFEIHMN